MNGKGLRELNRFFYLTGWTMGRRDVGKPEVETRATGHGTRIEFRDRAGRSYTLASEPDTVGTCVENGANNNPDSSPYSVAEDEPNEEGQRDQVDRGPP